MRTRRSQHSQECKDTRRHCFVTRDLWPFDSKINVFQDLSVEHLYAKFGDSSCIKFWDIVRKKQTDTQTNVGVNLPPQLPSSWLYSSWDSWDHLSAKYNTSYVFVILNEDDKRVLVLFVERSNCPMSSGFIAFERAPRETVNPLVSALDKSVASKTPRKTEYYATKQRVECLWIMCRYTSDAAAKTIAINDRCPSLSSACIQ